MLRFTGYLLFCFVACLTEPLLGQTLQDARDAYDAGDYNTALENWRPLADQGDADAQYNLGRMYDYGEGVTQDFAEAVRWYRLAADQGHADAQNSLGSMYDNGEGVAQDYAEAARWYQLAAEQGDALAQSNLGYMYHYGEGVAQDFAEAARWYRLAAEQGDALAQNNLGNLHLFGEGVTRDFAEAARLYRLAASQGEALAQMNLGALYMQGQGVSRDWIEAARWFRLAAEQGEPMAQYNLGYAHAIGYGNLPKDPITAYMWFTIAAANGNDRASASRDSLVVAITPDQVSDAQSRASMCMESGFQNCDAVSTASIWGLASAGTPGEPRISVRTSNTLALFSADGAFLRHAGEYFWGPSWSPEGDRLAVLMASGRWAVPVILDADSAHDLFPKPRNATYVYGPIWSPNGRLIALLQYGSSGFSIVVVDAITAEITAVGQVPSRFTADYPYYTAGLDAFSWSPDGNKILLSWQGVLAFDLPSQEVQVVSDQFGLAFWPPDSAGVCLLQYVREGPGPIELGHLGRFDFGSRDFVKIATPEEIADAGITTSSWLITGSILLSSDGTSVAVSMGNSSTEGDAIRVYDASPDCISDLRRPRLIVETSLVPAMDWSPEGDAMVIFEQQESEGEGFSFAARVIELETGRRVELLQWELEGDEVDVFALSGTLAWSR